MPLYAKFLKELMIRKGNWGENETVVLIEECSAIIQKKLPQKLKDPGSFQIPCIIGDMNIEKALCDLGASINLMSLAMMKRMRIEEVKPTRMALQLANRTFKFPHGVVEDLLVKVEEFIFPADFAVLNMEERANPLIILGRPFLATAGAIIDVQKGKLVLRLHKEKMVFNVFKAMSYPKESIGECRMVNIIENLVQGVLEEEQCEEIKEQDQQTLCGDLPLKTMDEPVMLDKTNLKGISPSMCMHNILLEEGAKPLRQQQRRLNPTVNEVVQKEMLKLWQVGVIYPISDSPWILLLVLFYDRGKLMMIQESPWFADIANIKDIEELPTNINKFMRRKLLNDAKDYIWDEPYLFKKGVDGILRRCISQEEGLEVL
ncbi:uncharacterized protein LOC130975015 [Arachis stenosperma]|uniref:uncharacterized protein LOC130975015 n=1 Tax=Arachis stenosperma TaxID=217475 RepID=UPI0025ABE49C|nr:uncharacterized protein LOC130975015 [Arachis stenosperma]